MDSFSFLNAQFFVFVVIVALLVIQMFALRKGNLVKVEYTKQRRLFWAIISSSIVAVTSIFSGNMYFLLLAVVLGLYLYFFKQYYAFKRNKS
jgi:hypothetical protein